MIIKRPTDARVVIDPVENLLVPLQRVLRLQDPVVLIWKAFEVVSNPETEPWCGLP
jgi:hypothetical protein